MIIGRKESFWSWSVAFAVFRACCPHGNSLLGKHRFLADGVQSAICSSLPIRQSTAPQSEWAPQKMCSAHCTHSRVYTRQYHRFFYIDSIYKDIILAIKLICNVNIRPIVIKYVTYFAISTSTSLIVNKNKHPQVGNKKIEEGEIMFFYSSS